MHQFPVQAKGKKLVKSSVSDQLKEQETEIKDVFPIFFSQMASLVFKGKGWEVVYSYLKFETRVGKQIK